MHKFGRKELTSKKEIFNVSNKTIYDKNPKAAKMFLQELIPAVIRKKYLGLPNTGLILSIK
jgi:hypothetical protein